MIAAMNYHILNESFVTFYKIKLSKNIYIVFYKIYVTHTHTNTHTRTHKIDTVESLQSEHLCKTDNMTRNGLLCFALKLS